MKNRFEGLSRVGRTNHNESNDCSVIAIAVATGLDYDTCHAALAKQGRRRGQGAYTIQMIKAVNDLGFEMTWDYNIEDNARKELSEKYNVNNKWFSPHVVKKYELESLKVGGQIWMTRGHAIGVMDGIVNDWTEEKLRKVNAIFRVTKKTA